MVGMRVIIYVVSVNLLRVELLDGWDACLAQRCTWS
jgi:hypothetical protein